MKYVRFQDVLPNLGVASKLGIFQLAYQLKHSPEASRYDDYDLRLHLDWLETHRTALEILYRYENYRTICWFKDSARAPLKRIWAIKRLLEEYGYWVDRVKTENPELIIYQDGWQIAAKPSRNRVRG